MSQAILSTMQVPPTGSPLSSAEADILQTTLLGNTIAALVREPLSILYQSVQKKRAISRKFGPWKKEAYSGGRPHLPHLDQVEFEAYLNRDVGILRPRAESQIESGWGYLLYALGIRPGLNVVKWMPAIGESLDSQGEGGVKIQVDGAVLCHIMNLYRSEIDWNSYKLGSYTLQSAEETKGCRLDFGELAWETSGGCLQVRFYPGPLEVLGKEKWPFGTIGARMEPKTQMLAYFNTLQYGISDTAFWLPPPSASLGERARKLVKFLDWLETMRRVRLGDKPPSPPESILITYDWLAQASRIKRRLLARGGHDKSLYLSICEHIERHPGLASDSTKRLRGVMKDEVYRLFLFGDATLYIHVGGLEEESGLAYPVSPQVIVREVLEGFRAALPDSDNYQLYLLREEVERILFAGDCIVLDQYTARHLRVIDFTRQSALWSQRCLME